MDPEPISLFFNVLEFETSVIIGVILLLVLLLFSALVSGAEVALFSLTPTDLNENSENYSKRLDIISKLLDSPKKLLATILVANNFINIAIVLLFAYLGNFIFEDISSLLIRFIVEVLLVTFLILFFSKYSLTRFLMVGKKFWGSFLANLTVGIISCLL